MNELINKDYLEDLNKIKETIKQNQNKAMVIVNSAMIMTYYEIGTIINKRKTWGSKYIQKLSEDLKEYGKGFSVRNLQLMKKFASELSVDEIMHQGGAQIPWRTISEIMTKSKSHDEMMWYINKTYKNSWSRSTVLKQFEAKAYERGIIEPSTTPSTKTDVLNKGLFKDSYVFDFLNKDNTKTEKAITKSLVDNVISFIQELGGPFSFVGKEYKLVVPGDDVFYIDILMYHLELHCYVVIEIKNRKFKPQDLGQLLFYVNAIDSLKKTNIDSETVGLVLCKDANSFVAKNTLNKIASKVGISKYKIFEELPEYLEKKLNEK
ncbi:MAG: PDDEXK nuclease domain-containing protein [bacterium]|nr:PDDEXK nuclease domain-containing protein [bacterium]